ncbi:hypothetical protein [Nonomuraea jiangxiensis]|uniref:Uncharacterized protein n=1 Tax=Nonomuraea jiangxiensis TaxID=633440 RepID=A0A1G9UW02_9ACTN|nr:hypothetical protein [Nonomuraea jiangxiensis]SDM64093.1 hypothetical protein SAMN05421869_15027 [Nonomuraea jiangxiensis]
MTNDARLHPTAPRRAAMKAVWAVPAAAMAVVATLACGTPAQAAQAAPGSAQAAPASAQGLSEPVRPLINERRCNSSEIPRQIWLTSASRPTRCFGGTVGGIHIGSFPVQWLSSGDYTGTIACLGGWSLRFNPGTDVLLNRTCTYLEIRHGS